MSTSGAQFSRAQVSQLLNIPAWLLANFSDDRYGYGLRPSVAGKKGRGKRGLYTLADVYKIAVAHRMSLVPLTADEIKERLEVLFPKKQDPLAVAVRERGTNAENVRYMTLNLCALALTRFQTGIPDGSLAPVPPEWRCPKSAAKQKSVSLVKWNCISEELRQRPERAFILMPFDDLLNWVDNRILGRELFMSEERKEA